MSTQDFEQELRAIVGAERVLADEPLAAHTTLEDRPSGSCFPAPKTKWRRS